jgi:methionyl-tRNA formyltransferase
VPISWTDTYGGVLHRVVAAFPDLVEETLASVAEGRARRSPQNHAQGTYFGGRGPGDEWLDWSDSSRNLHNKVRAITHPGPGARSVLDGRSVVIWTAFYDPEWPRYVATPGQVVGKDREGALVKTGDSVLLVKEAQGEGGVSQRPSWRIGTRLGRDVTGVLQSTDNRVQAGGVEPGKERSHDRR